VHVHKCASTGFECRCSRRNFKIETSIAWLLPMRWFIKRIGSSKRGCGSNCGIGNSFVLPNSYYSSNSNCQTSCNNINCNQFNGQYNSQYNSCANTCCGGVNSLNSWPTFGSSVAYSGFNNGYYNPYANNVLKRLQQLH
ncbi:hypothetical protein OSTOST_24581, partial [Ostertagia ostertagi]